MNIPGRDQLILLGSPLVRHDDPVESKVAAAKVKLARDRTLMLKAFDHLGAPATFREASVQAASSEGTAGVVGREESLRRRGSDLRQLGLIEQVGKRAGRATFKITDKGREAL